MSYTKEKKNRDLFRTMKYISSAKPLYFTNLDFIHLNKFLAYEENIPNMKSHFFLG